MGWQYKIVQKNGKRELVQGYDAFSHFYQNSNVVDMREKNSLTDSDELEKFQWNYNESKSLSC